MRIEHILTINGAILAVYHTDVKCYQYSIAFGDGGIYQPQEIYYTANKALEVGIEKIRITIGYQ
jgi:hypothetical protein